MTATNQYVAVYGEVGRYLGLTTHAVLALIAITVAIATDYPAARMAGVVRRGARRCGQRVRRAASGRRRSDQVGRPGFAGPAIRDARKPRLLRAVPLGRGHRVGGGTRLRRSGARSAALGDRRARHRERGAHGARRDARSVIGVVGGLFVIGVLWLRRTGATRSALSRVALAGAALLVH